MMKRLRWAPEPTRRARGRRASFVAWLAAGVFETIDGRASQGL